MSDLRKAAEMALKHLETVSDWDTTYPIGKAKEALRQALEQSEWVEITKGECDELFRAASDHIEYAYAIEAKLKEKNT